MIILVGILALIIGCLLFVLYVLDLHREDLNSDIVIYKDELNTTEILLDAEKNYTKQLQTVVSDLGKKLDLAEISNNALNSTIADLKQELVQTKGDLLFYKNFTDTIKDIQDIEPIERVFYDEKNDTITISSSLKYIGDL